MMFHRQPLLPIDSELVQSFQNDDEPDIEAFIDRMIDIRDKIKEVASRNISKSQSEQKKYYDSKHSTEVLIFSLAMFHLSFFCFLDLPIVKPALYDFVCKKWSLNKHGTLAVEVKMHVLDTVGTQPSDL